MSVDFKKMFAQPWEYFISRNIQIWHNSLAISKISESSFAQFHLDSLQHVRIHRGFHSDFYLLATGPQSKHEFTINLKSHLTSPDYLESLKQIYSLRGEDLLGVAKNTRLNFDSIKLFFEKYAATICLLDLTAHASKIVTNKVLELLKDYNNQTDIIAVFGAPVKPAPIQLMESDIAEFFRQPNLNFEAAAKELWKKYYWIPANFVGQPWGLDYFRDCLKNYEPKHKVANAMTIADLSNEQKYYLNLLGEISSLNEYRKSIFAKVNLVVRPVFEELGKRMRIGGWQEVNLCLDSEILEFLHSGKAPVPNSLEERKKLCLLFLNDKEEVDILYGQTVLDFENKFAPKADNIRSVKGVSASRGKVQGQCKIILSPADFASFDEGDILIAKMTSVDFIPLMKKAAAFVTDEGGLASHAAIVAREYGKPCIVGTKIGTKVFQNGDNVEVDAEKGIVRKI